MDRVEARRRQNGDGEVTKRQAQRTEQCDAKGSHKQRIPDTDGTEANPAEKVKRSGKAEYTLIDTPAAEPSFPIPFLFDRQSALYEFSTCSVLHLKLSAQDLSVSHVEAQGDGVKRGHVARVAPTARASTDDFTQLCALCHVLVQPVQAVRRRQFRCRSAALFG